MTLVELQSHIRNQLNNLRALDRIVHSVEFQQCLKLDPNNLKLQAAILSADLDSVREWMSNVIELEFCELSIRQLRLIAAQLGIRFYTALTKDELLIEIVQVKKNALKSKQIENYVGGVPSSTNGTQTVS